MTNISLFSIETQAPLNDFSSAIFKNLDVDNQMSQNCGQDEPLSWPKNAFFSCVIGIYFVAFFIDHPVEALNNKSPSIPRVENIFMQNSGHVTFDNFDNIYISKHIFTNLVQSGFVLIK